VCPDQQKADAKDVIPSAVNMSPFRAGVPPNPISRPLLQRSHAGGESGCLGDGGVEFGR